MEAVHQSMAEMMEVFLRRLDVIQDQLPTTQPASPGGIAEELATFKTFVLANFRALQSQIALLSYQVEQGEMRSRRKILLLHGVKEAENENTGQVVAKVMVERLKISGFTLADISRCHRMGRAATDRPRPILYKLSDIALRDRIWATKTSLKGSGITMSEFLTKARHDVFLAARQRFGISKCWTREGNIFVLGPDSSRHRVNSKADFAAIQEVEVPEVPAAKLPKPKPAAKEPATPKSKLKRAKK